MDVPNLREALISVGDRVTCIFCYSGNIAREHQPTTSWQRSPL